MKRLLAFGTALGLLALAVALRPPPPIPRRYHYYYFAPEATPGLIGRALSFLQPDPAAWLPSAASLLAAIAALVLAAGLPRRA